MLIFLSSDVIAPFPQNGQRGGHFFSGEEMSEQGIFVVDVACLTGLTREWNLVCLQLVLPSYLAILLGTKNINWGIKFLKTFLSGQA